MECIVLVGLPGAGKTTFYRSRLAGTHAHVSKDNFPHARSKDARQRELLERAFAAGQSVVVDNTNPRIADRAAVVAIARAHGAQAIAYYFDCSTRDCVARNERREGRGKVPKVAIFTVAKRLEPPTLAEGFDEIHHVTVKEDGSFEVRRL